VSLKLAYAWVEGDGAVLKEGVAGWAFAVGEAGVAPMRSVMLVAAL